MADSSLPPAAPARHRESYRVRWYETDPEGWATTRTLCQLLQEAAIGDAARLGVAVETLISSGMAWVLSRLRVTLKRWPRGADEVTVETWPHASSRLLIERRFLLSCPSGEIGSATSLWIVMDLERRRPVRLPAFILDGMRGLVDARARPWAPPGIPALEQASTSRTFEVRRTDLDMVGHVNNAHYPQWAVEAAPEEVWASHRPAELDVHFLGECRLGDAVTSESRRMEGGAEPRLLHRLARGDGTEVARATSRWSPVPGAADRCQSG